MATHNINSIQEISETLKEILEVLKER